MGAQFSEESLQESHVCSLASAPGQIRRRDLFWESGGESIGLLRGHTFKLRECISVQVTACPDECSFARMVYEKSVIPVILNERNGLSTTTTYDVEI